jgi:multicomponent Na+:H+ antiporter subunit D
MTVGLFAVAGIMVYRFKKRDITEFHGMFQRMPLTMSAFVVGALSIIGVPPTCGFFSKWYLIQGAVMAEHWAFVAALLFSSLINLILFFRIIEIGYVFKAPESGHSHGDHHGGSVSEAPLSMLIPTLAIAAGIIAIGLYNQTILSNIINFAVPKL